MNSPHSISANQRTRREPSRTGRVGAWLIGCALLAGCASSPSESRHAAGADYVPDNIYATANNLTPELKRVAVLPLATESHVADLIEGCETLDPVLFVELTKAKRFEVVRVRPEDLYHATGRAAWTGEEVLPVESLDALREAYGCDAVLFCQLTEFQPHAPMSIGWRMKLVDTRSRQILWAGDEVFDAELPGTKTKSHLYRLRRGPATVSADAWVMQNSPRRFGHEAAARLFATLPAR